MNQVLSKLQQAGLNLQAIFDYENLPEHISEKIDATGFAPHLDCQVLLLGNGGTIFWQELVHRNQGLTEDDHPVDSYVVKTIHEIFGRDGTFRILYPGNHFAPLTQLGKLSGWHDESPLGLGIHPEFGLWFAYRALILLKKHLIPTPVKSTTCTPDINANTPVVTSNRPSPCQQCTRKPCITACPASAVSEQPFNIHRCATHRLSSHSSCQLTCRARLACPAAPRHRYSTEQITYHYQQSLDSIKKYG